MAYRLELDRKIGNSDPISIRVALPSPADISNQPVGFYLWSTDRRRTRRIDGDPANVSVTDISEAEGAAQHTVWKLTYQPQPGQLSWEGTHLAEFRVDFGNNRVIDYPYGRSYIEVRLREHGGRPALEEAG